MGSDASGTPSELEDNEEVVSEVMIRMEEGKDGCQYPLSGNVLRPRQCF